MPKVSADSRLLHLVATSNSLPALLCQWMPTTGVESGEVPLAGTENGYRANENVARNWKKMP